MVEKVKEIDQLEVISLEDLEIIEDEIQKDTAPIQAEDPETAELLEEMIRDHRISTYLFLSWLDKEYFPQRVLYPSSGHDMVPKLVFGENRVVHTSLEGYLNERYFPQLGTGQKADADNLFLPFTNEAFPAITLISLPHQNLSQQLPEIDRVLTRGGVVALVQINHELVNQPELDDSQVITEYFDQSRQFEKIEVPEYLQKQGESQTNFLVFRKNLTYVLRML